MSLTPIRQGQDSSHLCSQFSVIDKMSDLHQISARDVNEKKAGFNTMPLSKIMIRVRDCGDQLPSAMKDLERSLLCLAADQIDDGVRLTNLLLKALVSIVDHGICAEIAHQWNVISRGSCDGLETRASGQLNRIGPDVPCRSVENHLLAFPELSLIKQSLPCGDGNDRNRSGFNVGQRSWLVKDHSGRSQRVFGIGPTNWEFVTP